ncbi:MAG: UDP-4-amino-4,6-dideoxy-N-acetyl-beta-L-altrosamine transaminase [Clostridiales bacterium]|nr:UDP-4-amino-4,6-dideoxy-N-acetyl-beta-L-altrosamine transaminase [Clostridiales bacterium]
MEKLAINGGYPVRGGKIYYGRQWIDDSDVEAVEQVLRSDYITCGPKVDELERTLCSFTGASYAVAVNSGTSALHCACIAAGIGPGDEVITTPMTFAASANCALYCGAKPVFADIDPKTYTIDPDSIRSKITEHTKAVVAVDFTGQAVKINEIRAICNEFNLIFIEDAAHSIATKYNGVQVGNLADMTCFSFHPVKTITGGEGGAILTNSKELYDKLVLAHTHGITHDKELMSSEAADDPWYYEQISLGFNYRLTDFQAALITNQLGKIDMFASRRKQIVAHYNEAFAAIPEIIVQEEIPESDTCRHLYIIQLDLDKLTCTRREFFDAMSRENVQCQIHYIPVYWFPYYRQMGYERGLCPNAERLYDRIMSIPLYPKMTDQDVEDVVHAVKKVVNFYRRNDA